MEALSSNSPYFLQYDVLKPLYDYAVTIPVVSELFVKLKVSDADLEAECRIFSRALGGKTWHADENGKIDLVDVANIVEKDHGKTAPVLTELYQVAVTAGFTSTRVECLFSSLTRADSPQRRSMKTKRECDHAYLAFESQVLMNEFSFESFLAEWKLSARKLFDI